MVLRKRIDESEAIEGGGVGSEWIDIGDGRECEIEGGGGRGEGGSGGGGRDVEGGEFG
jgi:hypothetical protein